MRYSNVYNNMAEHDADDGRASSNTVSFIRNINKVIYNPRILFADPEVARILFSKGLIANQGYSSKEELAGITDEDMMVPHEDWQEGVSIFFESTITTFDELQYFTGLTRLDGTFYGCSSLIEAPIILESVTAMSNTFHGCSSLIEAPIIPDSVTSMWGAFRNCTSLVNAPSIPESVTGMSFTFYGCSNLVEAPIIPEGVISIHSAFSNCSNLVEAPIIPEGVTSMHNVFSNCSNLVEAPIIPESVWDMESTFSGCSNLTEAPVIPNLVTRMAHTFTNCSSLIEAPIIPDSVTNMMNTFLSCTNLTEAPIIPDSVTEMRGTFDRNSNLNGKFIIEAVTPPTANAYTFRAVNVVSINVPAQSVEAYKAASGWIEHADKIFPMNAIVFEDPLAGQILFDAELIADPTYSTKEELALITNYDLNKDFDEYGYDAGHWSSIFISSEITKIPELQYFTGVTNMYGTFQMCSSLTEPPIIPNSVTYMSGTFDGCSSLTEAPIIPNSVTNMDQTFSGCSNLIEAPIIPNSVTNMYQTFYGCPSLNGRFIIEAVTPPTINSYTFYNVNVISIKVPAQSVQAYKTASGWIAFADKIFPIT